MNDDKKPYTLNITVNTDTTQPEAALDGLKKRLVDVFEEIAKVDTASAKLAEKKPRRDIVPLVQLGVVIALLVADIIVRVVCK